MSSTVRLHACWADYASRVSQIIKTSSDQLAALHTDPHASLDDWRWVAAQLESAIAELKAPCGGALA